MSGHLQTAIEAARAAGDRQLEQFRDEGISYEPADGASIDRESERLIVARLTDAYPDHAVVTEERGTVREGTDRWIVDPLDGTANYVRGLTAFAVSIAFERDGRTEAGVVYHPPSGTAYAGSRTDTPTEALGVSTTDRLDRGLVAVPYASASVDRDALWGAQRRIAARAAGVRSSGAGALDLARVAVGRTDAACGFDQHEWDRAAGLLLVELAGGRVTAHDGRGEPTGDYLASNGRLHETTAATLGG